MIKYNLKCNNNHEFESWFADSKEFDKLNRKKLLEIEGDEIWNKRLKNIKNYEEH